MIDTHNDFVCDAVWNLYEIVVRKFPNAPTLIEWDQDIPEFSSLIGEAKKAERFIQNIPN